jgi:acyl-CoA synthetase (AMP-forming)/AMP-acid ligase II
VAAQTAILRAGAAWVAINQRLAAPEVAFMLAHSGARVLLADGDVPGDALGAGSPVEVCDVSGDDRALERRLERESAEPLALEVGEDDVGRLRYTSGTTGQPKAAVLTHRSALTSLRTLLAELHDLGPDDVFVHVAPLTHASEALVAPAFWRGARTIVCTRFDPVALRELIARERVTTLFLVPSMIAALVDDPGADPAAFASLRTVVYGAAPMPAELMARALALFGPVLFQIYGMSECPFPITTLRKEDHLDPRLRGSCGLPVASSEVRVLDAAGRPAAPGTVGRIAVRGPQLMREYWQDPAATAAAIVDGWFLGGDVGVVDEAGFLTLVDRSDDVIITGGFNVYPREVEAVLEAHPGVAEAAVAAIPHARWGQGVGAWVVRRAGGEALAEAELIEFCRARLAGYKKPLQIRFVEALPRNPTGKLLRRRLRENAD